MLTVPSAAAFFAVVISSSSITSMTVLLLHMNAKREAAGETNEATFRYPIFRSDDMLNMAEALMPSVMRLEIEVAFRVALSSPIHHIVLIN